MNMSTVSYTVMFKFTPESEWEEYDDALRRRTPQESQADMEKLKTMFKDGWPDGQYAIALRTETYQFI